ncbi:signal peptidase I [Limisphaera sp. VF-2]|uniref:signal peptidase I n=1 Tax=Limisphaera sp. VF-2 TaxID=3400418 RepID=UPI0017632056
MQQRQAVQGPQDSAATRLSGQHWLVRLAVGRHPRRTLVRAVVLALLTIAVFRYVLLPVRVQGISMWPTYQDRQWGLVNRLAYRWSEPRRGDVVCVRFTAGEHVMLLKRIVALPGETVGFRNGRLYVNGRPLEEPYVKTPCDWNEPERQLGPDEYYVVGDNRSMPREDHMHGITERWRIVGKLVR